MNANFRSDIRPMQITDSRVRVRTEQLMKAWTTELNPVFEDYLDFYKMRGRVSVLPMDEQIEEARDAGITRMVVCGGNRADNDHILDLSRSYEEVIPVGGVHLKDGIRAALAEIERVGEEGGAAINLGPFMMKLDVNDRRLFPVYAYCELIGIPIIVHSSIHYWRDASMWHGQPQYFDDVAVHFPGLKIIMSHGGNGFGPTVLAVAQRHPNVFLEFSALTPSYMAPEFLQAANTYLREKCMFGTDYPLVPFERGIEVWKEALREDVWDLFFHHNVERALFDPPR